MKYYIYAQFCFGLIVSSVLVDLCFTFTHILQDCFTRTGQLFNHAFAIEVTLKEMGDINQ